MKGKNPVTIFIVLIILGVLGMAVVVTADVIRNLRPAESETLPADTPTAGIGRDAESADVGIWLASVCADAVPSLAEYTEGDGPAPEWYRPDEPMAAEWTDNARQSDFNPIQRTDAGCPDWNLDSTLYGWDGHGAEVWELDLLARVFYMEFWQPDMMLCEAGCDAILRLWESGEKGRTLGEVLSSRNEDGSWTYSVYPDIWTADYDEDGLAWCRDYTAERFAEGPVWIAPYFRLDYYHDWAVPAYQIGNVYFSVGG